MYLNVRFIYFTIDLFTSDLLLYHVSQMLIKGVNTPAARNSAIRIQAMMLLLCLINTVQ